MTGKMSRRELGLALATAAAVAALPESADAQNIPFHYLGSSLDSRTIELQKERAVQKLRASIPPLQELRYLLSHAQYLKEESQMYVPDVRERERVISNAIDEHGNSTLTALANKLTVGESGLYIFADIDSDGRNFQRLYVLKKESAQAVRFEKAYRVSTSVYGFGNEEKSNQTPLGYHRILSGEVGRYAEVVVAGRNSDNSQRRLEVRDRLDKTFTKVVLDSVSHWFARTFGESAAGTPEERQIRDAAEVITARYTINETRGIHIHGTNRTGVWDKIKNSWTTFLGGRRRSTGCIRMSNTDIYDLGLSGHIGLPQYAGRRLVAPGTSVMIHATRKARGIINRGESPQQIHPDDREPNLFDEIQALPKQPKSPANVNPVPRKVLPKNITPESPPQKAPSSPRPRRPNLFEEI